MDDDMDGRNFNIDMKVSGIILSFTMSSKHRLDFLQRRYNISLTLNDYLIDNAKTLLGKIMFILKVFNVFFMFCDID